MRAGSRTIQFELANAPTINFTLTNPGLVVPGSKVAIHGMGTRGWVSRCVADSVFVTSSSRSGSKKH